MSKPTRKIQSVYRNQNAIVRAIFERAGDARKVLCVALDYAKRKHVALICDGHGDILKAAFPVENNAAGIAHLIKEISATARRRKIPKDQIFLGGVNGVSPRGLTISLLLPLDRSTILTWQDRHDSNMQGRFIM